MFDADRVKRLTRPSGLPFQIGKIGHIVINVRDVAKSAEFYTQILGFQISDVYPDEMVPGGMGFCAAIRHHGIAGRVDGGRSAEHRTQSHRFRGAEPRGSRPRSPRAPPGAHHSPDGGALAARSRSSSRPGQPPAEIYWGIDQIGSDGRARPAAEWSGKPSIEAAIAEPVPGQDLSLYDPALLAR